MNPIKLAQALIPVADELDDNGLNEDAIHLDNLIKKIVSNFHADMIKKSQIAGERQKDRRGIPMPYPGEDYQNWYASLSASEKGKVHRNYRSWYQTAGGGEAKRAFDNLQHLNQNQQYAPAQNNSQSQSSNNSKWKFLGNDVNTGGAWQQDTTTNKYWYQDPVSKQYQSFDTLPK